MKTLGLIVVFLTCTISGVVKSFEYSEILNELEAFILFVKFIKREIYIYQTRQKDIFERFENRILEKNGFLQRLRMYEIVDEKSPLYHVMKDMDKEINISDDAKKSLLEFAESFGQTSISEQITKCDSTISNLEELYKRYKEENEARVKLCRSAGCIIGAFAVLLLI